MHDTTVAERLGAFAAGLEVNALPEAVTRRAKACLVHAVAVSMAGSVTAFGRQAELTSAGWTDRPDRRGFARSLVTGHWHPLEAAAFINGVQLHARAQEDTHGTFHPGVCVIPAALAAAEDQHADGATFLAAVTAGYEVGIALSEPLTERTTPPFRATAVFGPVAAAAAVGRIRGFDPQTMTSALAIAVSLSGGTAESFGAGSDEWHFQSGIAAATGLRAAQLAAAGVSGSRNAVEASSGFLDCFAAGESAPSSLAQHLGRTWNLLGVTFKPYPVCAFNQAPAMLAARLHQAGIRAQDVSSIELRMNEREATYPGMPAKAPFNSVANTLMSARFAFATALVQGDITYDSLLDFTNGDVLRVVGRTELLPDPGRLPKTVHARLVLTDGSVVEDAIEDSDALLSWDMGDVVRNAERLAAEAGVTKAGLQVLLEAASAVDELPSVEPLITAALTKRAVTV